MEATFSRPKIEGVHFMPKGKGKPISGSLVMTASHLLFSPTPGASSQKQEIWLQYMYIQEVKKKAAQKGARLLVSSKDFRVLEFNIGEEEDCNQLVEQLTRLALPDRTDKLYAFKYQPDYTATIDGWQLYDARAEYKRMGVPDESWTFTNENKDFKLCSTYGPLLFVPKVSSTDTIWGSAKFRSRGRLPALSYRYKNKAFICRCAQPLSGVKSKRSMEDEALVAAIHRCNPSDKQTVIVDTRPKINAMANKTAGKGYENIEGYPDCDLVFEGIQNIHVMRESLDGLLNVSRAIGISHGAYLSGLKDCGWLGHVRSIFATTMVIVNLVLKGQSVIVHCSDGWDRTAQTCSLASLLLDPYYRTMEGFAVLIEKEWLSFGHKFSDRNGFVKAEAKEISPVFLQFLEATWQLMQQFPKAFEFNELFLITLHDSMHSCRFGTFLGNCARERIALRLSERTQSVWTYMFSRKEDFLNPFYNPGASSSDGVLIPDLSPQNFQIWSGMYSRWEDGFRPEQHPECAFGSLQTGIEHEQTLIRIADDKIKALEEEIAALEKGEPLTTEVVECDVPPAPVPLYSVDACTLCTTSFDVIDTRHHCRSCGHVFCFRCAQTRTPLPHFHINDPVLVCNTCVKRLTE